MCRVIAGMATVDSRAAARTEVLAALLPQVHEMYVYHDHAGVLHVYRDGTFRGHLTLEQHRAHYGDAGKFLGPLLAAREGDMVITVDDDLLYPPDYVRALSRSLGTYPGACVSFHGRTFPVFPIKSYYLQPGCQKMRCLGQVPNDRPAQVLGTGTLAFRFETLATMRMEDFPSRNMADVHLAVYCEQHGIPRMALAHEKGWIKHSLLIDMKATIHAVSHLDDAEQTRRINAAFEPGFSA